MRLYRATPAILLVLAACGGEVNGPRRSDGTPLVATLADPAGGASADLRAGHLADARARLESALAADPDGMGALNDLAVSYSLQERFDAARQLFEEALARGGPSDQQLALVNLGELYAIDGYIGAAEAHLQAARAINPARPGPAYAAALLADARGERASTTANLREALAADPDGSARRGLAYVYPEERLHLEALVAEATGDAAGADARWRELTRGRFPSLAQAAQRHLEAP